MNPSASRAVWLALGLSALLPSACGGSNTDPVRCQYGGAVFDVGDDFPSDDGCNTCSCMNDGNVACTAKACLSCDDIMSMYGMLMDQAKTCDPEQPNQCTELVVEGLRCSCPTFINPADFDPDAASSLQSMYAAAECGAGILCGPCEEPVSSHCSTEGLCVDDQVLPGSAACKVGGVVYPDGADGIADPTSCNTCSCSDGQLVCTEIGCPMPCPADTKLATSCAQCGPADDCEIVEHDCLPACTDSCESGTCFDGACVSLCG